MANFAFSKLRIPDVLLVTPRKFVDSRGYFAETYSSQAFFSGGIPCVFVQDNQSYSAKRGTIRGLHLQAPPHAQAKLVRVLRGSIFDVAVDLRPGSASYGKWCAATLTAEGGEQLFIPRGFAHGFCTLTDDVEVAYKVDAPYAPESDGGLHWKDPDLQIEWPVHSTLVSTSAKDAALPAFRHFSPVFE